MELVRLNPTTYEPDELIEGHNSLIWTDRFLPEGEFEFKTAHISKTLKLLPEDGGDLVSLRDDNQVAMVETHEIKDGLLTIKGRTLDLLINDRTMLGPHNKRWKMAKNYSRLGAAEVLLWNSFFNGTGTDVLRTAAMGKPVHDQIANAILTETTKSPSAGPVTRRWLKQAPIKEQVTQWLKLSNLGLRVIRPPSTGPFLIVTVSHKGASKGNITRAKAESTNKLRLDVYNGVNRTINQTANTPIVFRLDADHIGDPSYLFSIKNWKNLAEVRSKVANKNIWRTPAESKKRGIEVRRLFVDAGEPDDGESKAEFKADLPQFGEDALSEHNRVVQFDAAVSPTAPYKYRTDYHLGDKVTLVGDYGIVRTMTVTEYIRSEDDTNGEQGFPALLPLPEEDGVSTGESGADE